MDTNDSPAADVIPIRAEPAPKPCALCDDPTPFTEATKTQTFEYDGQPAIAHELCFYRTQARAEHDAHAETKRVLASTVACWGGTVNVSLNHIRRAAESGFRLDQVIRPGGGIRLVLGEKIPPPPNPERIPALAASEPIADAPGANG